MRYHGAFFERRDGVHLILPPESYITNTLLLLTGNNVYTRVTEIYKNFLTA